MISNLRGNIDLQVNTLKLTHYKIKFPLITLEQDKCPYLQNATRAYQSS